MPTLTSTASPLAIDAYLQHITTIRSQLEALQRHADDHFGHDPDAIHWGHVGDLTRTERSRSAASWSPPRRPKAASGSIGRRSAVPHAGATAGYGHAGAVRG